MSRSRASSKPDGAQKAFHFLPSALFIIALNRRVEKKGDGGSETERSVCVYLSVPFVDLQPRRSFSPIIPNPSSLLLVHNPLSLSLSLSLSSRFLSDLRHLCRSVRYRRVSQRCITVNSSGNCTLNISGLSPCKHVKKSAI